MVDETRLSTKKIFGIVLPAWVDESLLKSIVVTAVSIVLMILVSMIFIWPKFASLVKMDSQIKSRVAISDQLEKAQVYLDEMGVRISVGDQRVLDMVLPKVFEPDYVLTSLRKLTEDMGVTLSSYTLKGGRDSAVSAATGLFALGKHTINITVTGDSLAVVRFLDRLEVSYPYVVVSKLTLSEVSKLVRAVGKVNMDMELNYYDGDIGKWENAKIVGLNAADEQTMAKLRTFTGLTMEERTNPQFLISTTSAVFSRGGLFGD